MKEVVFTKETHWLSWVLGWKGLTKGYASLMACVCTWDTHTHTHTDMKKMRTELQLHILAHTNNCNPSTQKLKQED